MFFHIVVEFTGKCQISIAQMGLKISNWAFTHSFINSYIYLINSKKKETRDISSSFVLNFHKMTLYL